MCDCKNKKISIIVPVYKVEKYLDTCLESIVNQTYKNLEIILVDDGSPDRCPEICETWAKKDNRIRVIHQENMGAGAARNAALDIFTGGFVAFVDSDDYMALNMYETLMKLFEEDIDIVECDYISVEDGAAKFEQEVFETKTYSTDEAMQEHILDHHFRQLIWNKLYRRRCVDNIAFPTGKKIDDEFWTYQVLGKAKKLKRCNLKLYAYRQQENSVMHTLSPGKRIQAVEAKMYRHTFVREEFPELLGVSYLNLISTCLYQSQKVLKDGEKKEREEVLEYCKKVISMNKIKKQKFQMGTLKQQIWITMAEKSLYYTCKIRNLLGIGV